jgi:hypothetical protein
MAGRTRATARWRYLAPLPGSGLCLSGLVAGPADGASCSTGSQVGPTLIWLGKLEMLLKRGKLEMRIVFIYIFYFLEINASTKQFAIC